MVAAVSAGVVATSGRHGRQRGQPGEDAGAVGAEASGGEGSAADLPRAVKWARNRRDPGVPRAAPAPHVSARARQIGREGGAATATVPREG